VTTSIPNRAVFRAQEVCEIAQVQPYVLKSWEAEFPDLGMSKAPGAPRVYRRADVERVLRLKQLVFEEGLTLAGARRQLGHERGEPAPAAEESISDAEVAELLDQATLESLRNVRRGLTWILGVLSGGGVAPEDYVLVAEPSARRRKASAGTSSAKPGRARAAGKSGGSRSAASKRPARGRRR
jgi:DNA-binding transcriptional MerR regulator